VAEQLMANVADFKKAYVRIKEGQTIPVFAAAEQEAK
jgi:hypothetical protein